jgi:3-phytase
MKYVKPILVVSILFLLAILLENEKDRSSNAKIIYTQPCVETMAKTPLKDADDPCIWVHPTNPELSTVICTDKNQGLAVYDLEGNELQFLHLGRINNVDMRYAFPFQNKKIDLVSASSRSSESILLFTVNPETRLLEAVPSEPIRTNLKKLYGLCMYKSFTGLFYVFVTSTEGLIEQWELFEDPNGKINAKLVRSMKASSKSEGCVADDELGFFYLAEEQKGIWQYSAEPDGDIAPVLIAHVNPVLLPDIEGLAIYYGRMPGTGYLIAVSQGSNRFTILDRANNNAFVALFEITGADGIDGVESADGVDITSRNLGEKFPKGLLVAHDGLNLGGDTTNFKYVSMANLINQIGDK